MHSSVLGAYRAVHRSGATTSFLQSTIEGRAAQATATNTPTDHIGVRLGQLWVLAAGRDSQCLAQFQKRSLSHSDFVGKVTHALGTTWPIGVHGFKLAASNRWALALLRGRGLLFREAGAGANRLPRWLLSGSQHHEFLSKCELQYELLSHLDRAPIMVSRPVRLVGRLHVAEVVNAPSFRLELVDC